MRTPGFSVRLDTNCGVACAYVAGEIDLASAGHLRGSIELALSAPDLDRLVIDLGAVTFCDSTGLQVLVDVRRSCQERGVVLVLERPDDRLRSTLKIAGLTDHFTIEP